MKTFRYQCVQIGHIRNGLILVQASFNSFIILLFCFCWCFVLVCLGFIFWFCFRCCWFLGFFGYSKSYFSVNSNKDNITDTVVYVSFLFIYFFFFGQTIKLQNIAKVCCVYTSTY